MAEFEVTLNNCDLEPIHIPGQIQAHGFLLALDKDLFIRYYSDNIFNFIGEKHIDLLGKPLEHFESIFGNLHPPDFIRQLIHLGNLNESFDQINPCNLKLLDKPYYMIINPDEDYYLLEFEPAVSDTALDVQKMIGHSLSEMLADKNLQSLLDNSVRQVKKIIQFDRVMIYRFAEDGHGEVISEARNEELLPWLGLHYPATDIPKQARDLYKLNFTRLIADVESVPSRIMTMPGSSASLNLTHSQLRAVSPIHIQYLKNMGVASSFSISLIYKNELWGLIACHNYRPRFIDFKSRQSSRLIGQILSSALEFRQDEENQQIKDRFKNNLQFISKYLQKNENIEDSLVGEDVNLLDLADATGAAFYYEKTVNTLGLTPDKEELGMLFKWIRQHVTQELYYTSSLSKLIPEAERFKKIASGMMVSVLSRELEEYIIWFKPEQLKIIQWAGKPDKPIEIMANGLQHISPRNSFEAWSETVVGTSESWKIEEFNSALLLKEEIKYAISQKAGAIRMLNEKLRQAYEELDTFSFTISHDLKNPISVIKSYAQVMAADKTIGERGQRIMDRIADRAEKMNLMINEVLDYSRIGRSEIEYRNVNVRSLIDETLKEMEIIYNLSLSKITIGETPDLQGDPTMMMQVFSNLISNAIKYSQDSDPPEITIEGWVEGQEIIYHIKDNGLGIAARDHAHVFALFKRMDNVKNIEGTGVGLAIVKRIIEKHRGKIWLESEPGKGSDFFITFSKPAI